MPKTIKESLEKIKILDKEWKNDINNDNLEIIINDCLNTENTIKTINIINENMTKYASNLKMKFYPENDEEIKNL